MAGLKQKHLELESNLTTLTKTVNNIEDECQRLWRCDDETKELARSLVRDAVDKMQAEARCVVAAMTPRSSATSRKKWTTNSSAWWSMP